MVEQKQPVIQTILRGCSRLLLLVGAAVFFVGERAGFVLSEEAIAVSCD